MPQVSPAHPLPETFQMTALLLVPVTVAVNCCWPPTFTCAVDGETVTVGPDTTVTVAVADLLESATEVAVTVTVGGFGTTEGAVYSPLAVTMPQAAPLQPAPETLHRTAMFPVPVTVAVNCCCPFTETCVVGGEIMTVTPAADTMITLAEADFVGSATDVAVTVAADGLGTVGGAV